MVFGLRRENLLEVERAWAMYGLPVAHMQPVLEGKNEAPLQRAH
jgi:hypothetical protein